MNDVKQFWDRQAEQHGASPVATSPDHYYRDMEIDRIIPFLRDHTRILDVGCGNGYSTLKFAGAYPSAQIIGLDYSEQMIEAACAVSRYQENVRFVAGDVLHGPLVSDCTAIVTERCLINLASWDDQKKAILNLREALPEGGRLILVENMKDGLTKLNTLRQQFDLPAINERWHNRYMILSELMPFLQKYFRVVAQENIGNLYYILSRVVYAKLAAMEGKEPDYDHPINKIAAQLPSLGRYDFSPNYLIACVKL